MDMKEGTRRESDSASDYAYVGGWSKGESDFWVAINGFMHLQAVQWEPAGQQILDELGDGTGLRVVDIGCGGLGWLRLLSRWVGETGAVVGTEIAEPNAEPARHTVRGEGLSNVQILVDDVFHSDLPDHSFDLVHARNMLGPVGRPEEQLATYSRLVKPEGWLVLEDVLNPGLWTFNPEAPANERLVALLLEHWVSQFGRSASAGRLIRTYLRRYSERPVIRSHILTLPPGHAYRALPMVMATLVQDELAANSGSDEMGALLAQAHEELQDPDLWCTSYPLAQGYARMP
jgi:ubiquinone/menaquinone biosynthesis C-methylase UbiE